MSNFSIQYGPWALVAGASEGLGAAFAESLAARGLHLLLIARRREKLQLLASELQARYGVEVRYQDLDLADHQQLRAFIAALDLDIGLLVYNAAYAPIGYFDQIPEQDLFRMIDVNVKSPLLLTRLVGAEMLKRKRGGIILMSSLAGTQGSPKIATYAATKAFNTILAEGLWGEMKAAGVDVLASCAGAIRTPGYQQASQAAEAPGTLDAAAVAEQTLLSLGRGPTIVPGLINKIARLVMARLLPRKMAIAIMKKNTKDLT